MNLDDLIQSIDDMPLLSDTAFLIQQIYAYGYENVDIPKLIKIIESDVSLAINILKMLNAPIYGFSRKVSSISQAVILFGAQKIYGLILNYSINDKLKANTRIFGLSSIEFNEMCHLQSSLLLQWYITIEPKTAQFLAPLALIMEAGKLVLANEIMKKNYAKEYKKSFASCNNIEECEYELVGTTSYFLSGELFDYWNLDTVYVDILRGIDFEEYSNPRLEKYIEILDVIRTAINPKGILTKVTIYEASGIVEDLNLDVKKFIKIALNVKKQYEKVKVQRN